MTVRMNIEHVWLPGGGCEVEVLTIHLLKGNMRVRYKNPDFSGKKWEPKFKTIDVDATPFFEEFVISRRTT